MIESGFESLGWSEKLFEPAGEFLLQSLGLASPFCPLYLATAGICCLVWLLLSPQWDWHQAWAHGQRAVWKNRRSIRAEGVWALLQLLFLRTPLAALHVGLFEWSYELCLEWGGNSLGYLLSWQGPRWLEALAATFGTMLSIDFAAYGLHRALHGIPLLWQIHKVHHRATFLTPFTTFRQHPFEPILLNGARALAAGLTLGLIHSIFPQCTPVWTLGGMGIGFFFYMFTVNLHHAPIPIRYPKFLGAWLLSPHLHHLHHSRAAEHHGKNFGVVFSLWDRFFNSYLDQALRLGELKFGLDEAKDRADYPSCQASDLT